MSNFKIPRPEFLTNGSIPAALAAIFRPVVGLTNKPKLVTALVAGGIVVAATVAIYKNPPVAFIEPGELGLRTNRLTGVISSYGEGALLSIPGVHSVRRVSLREQAFALDNEGADKFQSLEGLSIGIDFLIRFAIDGDQAIERADRLPKDIEAQWVRPAIEAVLHKHLSQHTVREIYSSKRQQIAQNIETELKQKLAQDGVILKSVQMGRVRLPDDYTRGMESLLAEELAAEKMRFTLDLKAKQIKERELESEAQKIQREKLAQAAAQEQVIAAKAQEEAMRHIIPFKEKQIAQRQLEAEAQKQARIRTAEGDAQARKIEAAGEAASRQKLADAEAYRQERLGKVASEQMAREGALISKHPLLVQKAMVDKLSDKVTVIVAPPGVDGRFLGAGITGNLPAEAVKEAAARPSLSEEERTQ